MTTKAEVPGRKPSARSRRITVISRPWLRPAEPCDFDGAKGKEMGILTTCEGARCVKRAQWMWGCRKNGLPFAKLLCAKCAAAQVARHGPARLKDPVFGTDDELLIRHLDRLEAERKQMAEESEAAGRPGG